MTILEVLIYDPLYNWSLTPAKAYRLQYGRDADANTKSKWENNQSCNQGRTDADGCQMQDMGIPRKDGLQFISNQQEEDAVHKEG